MPKYKVKPEDVDAQQFTGDNWRQIADWLGPHLTKTEEWRQDDIIYYVFDVETKKWLAVKKGDYIVQRPDYSLTVMWAAGFEAKWEIAPPNDLWIQPSGPGYPPFGPVITNVGDNL